jgi:hypothetical protein
MRKGPSGLNTPKEGESGRIFRAKGYKGEKWDEMRKPVRKFVTMVHTR